PRQAAAQETAAAWLPLEWVTIPREASSSLNEKMALVAPRILNEPVFCRFSHLKKSRAPVSASRVAESRTGVRWILGAMRSWASLIACQLGGSMDAVVFVDMSGERRC